MYIGVTIDPERRWAQHRSMNTKCSILKNAFNKYGVENFTFTLLVCGEDNHIDEMEVKAIEIFNTQAPNGYNITLGGDGANLVKWYDEWNKYLGTAPDKEIASLLGVHQDVVASRRRGSNIKSYAEQNRFKWEDYDHLLGTKPDCDLAKGINASTSAISLRRKQLNIPRYKKPSPFNNEVLKLLGKISDKSISEKCNIPIGRVIKERQKLNIPSIERGCWIHKRDWSEEELSYITNTELTTEDLVKILNLSRATIQSKRKELGVKYNRFGKREKYEMTSDLTEELLDDTLTDKYFKDKYGMSSSTVSAKRKQIINSLKEEKNVK